MLLMMMMMMMMMMIIIKGWGIMGSAANCKLGQRWVQWLGERWLIVGRLWLGQPYANEQKEVGPTLAIIVGPTQLHMLAQLWPNH